MTDPLLIPTLGFFLGGLEVPLFLGIILFILGVFASIRVVRQTEGAALPLWLVVIWFIPIFGAILTLYALRIKAEQAPAAE